MLNRTVTVIAAVAAVTMQFSCVGEQCKAQSDCPLGSYCMVEVTDDSVSGTCRRECVSGDDCPGSVNVSTVPVCSRDGRCAQQSRPPKLRVLEPENDSLLPANTRRVRLSGEVETAAPKATVVATPLGRGTCAVGLERTVVLENPRAGELMTIPFIINDVELDPGLTTINLRVQIGGASRVVNHLLEIPCPGCAEISVSTPESWTSVPGLVLPALRGTISPGTVESALWRIRSEQGDVFDGPLTVSAGAFEGVGLPLFAGFNRVEVIVSGVGGGIGESRCSLAVTSAVGREKGLRVLLNWDGDSADLDLHIVGPNGRLFDPLTNLSSRNTEGLGGVLVDDFDGFGPEAATIDALPDGVYGVVVEPVFDDRNPGTTAFMRILHKGKSVSRGPLGPQHLTDKTGELWVVGVLTVTSGNVQWRYLNERIDGSMPPTRPPSDWPMFY